MHGDRRFSNMPPILYAVSNKRIKETYIVEERESKRFMQKRFCPNKNNNLTESVSFGQTPKQYFTYLH